MYSHGRVVCRDGMAGRPRLGCIEISAVGRNHKLDTGVSGRGVSHVEGFR
jgi:hypothetical protein